MGWGFVGEWRVMSTPSDRELSDDARDQIMMGIASDCSYRVIASVSVAGEFPSLFRVEYDRLTAEPVSVTMIGQPRWQDGA
jgi:hypothetical protein